MNRLRCLASTLLGGSHESCRGWIIREPGIRDGNPRCPSWRRAFAR